MEKLKEILKVYEVEKEEYLPTILEKENIAHIAFVPLQEEKNLYYLYLFIDDKWMEIGKIDMSR